MSSKKYLSLENIDNSCWLDAAIVLIANNVKIKQNVENHQNSWINNIITKYNEALATLNASSETRRALKQSKIILRSLQRDTLNYLKEFLKFKSGDPESAFCALLNLIYRDNSSIREHLNTTWIWNKQCSYCLSNMKSKVTKPIITLTKVKNFNPEIPTSLFTCTCGNEEEMKVEFVEISDCLIFHFEKGAGKGKTIPFRFSIEQREYHLTSIIMYEASTGSDRDHFVTWIRQPFTGKWLDCDDLNNTVVYFSNVKPNLKLKNIYIVIYETFDNLSKTRLETVSYEDIIASNTQKIELIDLSADKKSLLNCSSNVEMIESLPSKEKLPNQNGMVNQNVNCFSSNETETSKDEVKNMTKPSKENCSSNVEMVIESLPSKEKLPKQKCLVKPDVNCFSSDETKISEDEVKSMAKPSKENLSHYENKTSEDKTSIVKPIESLPRINEKSKNTGARPKVKTDRKDLTDSQATNYNPAENSEKDAKTSKKSLRRPAIERNLDKEKLSQFVSEVRSLDRERLSQIVSDVVPKTFYAIFGYMCKKRMDEAKDTDDSSSTTVSPEHGSDAAVGATSCSDNLTALTNSIAEMSVSDARSAPPNDMEDSDKKE